MMSLPVEKGCAEMDEMQMPDTIYSLLIEKYFDRASSAAFGHYGAFDGFSPLYNSSRFALRSYLACIYLGECFHLSFLSYRNWKGFVINEQFFYFTPTSWSLFSDQHITLGCIKIIQHQPCLLASRGAALEHNLEDADA